MAQTAGAAYTRYADDLEFSGDEAFARAAGFSTQAAAIALEEGFRINYRKTRIIRKSQRQHLEDLVVNEKATSPRRDFKLLEAILINCIRSGPTSQNRENHPDFQAHLEGRVGFAGMVSPEKGRRLRTLLQSIDWSR